MRRAIVRMAAVNDSPRANYPAGIRGPRAVAIPNSVRDIPHRKSEKKNEADEKIEFLDPSDVEIDIQNDGGDEIKPNGGGENRASFELHVYPNYTPEASPHNRRA
jgi:hypothetical protein